MSFPPGMHPGEDSAELPRFVALLRMAHGPVEQGAEHCGELMALEELEDVGEEGFFDPNVKARCILTCRQCGQVVWGWFD